MVKVISKYTVTPGKLAEFRAVSVRLRSAALKERGCLGFEILQDVQDDHTICIIEEWHDGESLSMHMQSGLFKTVMPRLHELQTGKPDVTVCRLLIQ
ncbi:MAG: putative quinol monooxygenase [Spirochaetota bacterium]